MMKMCLPIALLDTKGPLGMAKDPLKYPLISVALCFKHLCSSRQVCFGGH